MSHTCDIEPGHRGRHGAQLLDEEEHGDEEESVCCGVGVPYLFSLLCRSMIIEVDFHHFFLSL